MKKIIFWSAVIGVLFLVTHHVLTLLPGRCIECGKKLTQMDKDCYICRCEKCERYLMM